VRNLFQYCAHHRPQWVFAIVIGACRRLWMCRRRELIFEPVEPGCLRVVNTTAGQLVSDSTALLIHWRWLAHLTGREVHILSTKLESVANTFRRALDNDGIVRDSHFPCIPYF
jgi:hypothetical protein